MIISENRREICKYLFQEGVIDQTSQPLYGPREQNGAESMSESISSPLDQKDGISDDPFFNTILVEDFTLDINDEKIIEPSQPSLMKKLSLPLLYDPNSDLPLPLKASPQGISQDPSVVQDTTLLKDQKDGISDDPFSVFNTILVEDFTLDIDDETGEDDGPVVSFGGEKFIETSQPSLLKTRSLPLFYDPSTDLSLPLDFTLDIDDDQIGDCECDGPKAVKFGGEKIIDTSQPSLMKSLSLPLFYDPSADFPLTLKASSQAYSQDSSVVQDTTLLKHVPYDGDDKNLFVGYPDFEVGPVFEVVGVYICHDKDVSWEQFEIYGEISVIDEKSNKRFCMYERKPDDPEVVYPPDHDFLSLTPEPIAPLMKGKIIFNLTDKTRDTHFKEEKSVEYSITDDCEDDKRLRVKGIGGFYVEMLYTIIPFAHIAKVSSTIFHGPSESKIDRFEIVGDIIGDGISFLKEKYFEAVECYHGKSARYRVELSRTVFAIPVYSKLYVKINIHHHETELLNSSRASSPYGVRTDDVLYFDCEDKNHCLTMCVTWYCPAEYFGLLHQLNKPVISDEYVEVFSVYVGGGNSTHALCGSIIVRDPKRTVYIFSRKRSYPDKLSSFKYQLFMRTVSVAWPDWWVLEKDFLIYLNLQDNQGNPVCRGSICPDDSYFSPTRFDRRICTVIPGENGHFVAVHYSIFRNGLRATVTVICEGPCNSFDVYGSVYAEYSNHDYSLMYDQNYYRIIIFNRSEEYCAKVENGSKIPLSKSKVTAPADCSHIVVYVDLKIRPTLAPFNTDHYAIGQLKFKTSGIGCSEHVLIYRRQSCMGRVTVKVDWNP